MPMTAQGGGAAALDGIQHLSPGPSHPGPIPFDEALPLGREGCQPPRGWAESFLIQPARRVNGFRTGDIHCFQGIGGGLQVPAREVQIDHRVSELDVTEHEPNRAQVSACF